MPFTWMPFSITFLGSLHLTRQNGLLHSPLSRKQREKESLLKKILQFVRFSQNGVQNAAVGKPKMLNQTLKQIQRLKGSTHASVAVTSQGFSTSNIPPPHQALCLGIHSRTTQPTLGQQPMSLSPQNLPVPRKRLLRISSICIGRRNRCLGAFPPTIHL